MENFKKTTGMLLLLALLVSLSACAKSQDPAPKVLMHYMGWYGDAQQSTQDSLRHWRFGHANQPLIGNYDSHSESLLTYHLLLSWASGIDGVVINVKDEYDDVTMKKLIVAIDKIKAIDSVSFDYEFAISYDDQGFDLQPPLDTAITKLSYLRDSILPSFSSYVELNEHPIIFSFDYPNKYLSSTSFRAAIDAVFDSNAPLLIWNTLDGVDNKRKEVDAFYPWVQPGKYWDKEEGLVWGKEYLDYFYPEVNKVNAHGIYDFTCGGVWPGFDDRKNHSWGGNRLMDRQDGVVYDSTWAYIHHYDQPLPMAYVVIETWNDWNEGTEIEPSLEYGYQYLLNTITQVNRLKSSQFSLDTLKFDAAVAIYEASHGIETQIYGADKQSIVREAIAAFLKEDFEKALSLSHSITQ